MIRTPSHHHTVPIQLHQIEDGLVLAAPMPGLEPSDITVVIASDTVRLLGKFRGARLPHEGLLTGEWTVGPYYREVVLPQRVNGPLTQATYSHGVLVLAMPTLAPGTLGSYTAFELEHVTATRGQRVRLAGPCAARPGVMGEERPRGEAMASSTCGGSGTTGGRVKGRGGQTRPRQVIRALTPWRSRRGDRS